MAKSRWKRRLGFGFVVVMVVVVALIALAPTILNLGPGAKLVSRSLGEATNGTANVASARFSWFGEQKIEGIQVYDGIGDLVIDVNSIRVDQGLASLLRGPARVTGALSGFVHGTLREDGTVRFGDLGSANGKPPASKLSAPAPTKDAPFLDLAGIPALQIAIDNLHVQLDQLGARIVEHHFEASGPLSYEPGGDLSIEFAGEARSSESEPGAFSLSVAASRLFDADGRFTPGGASLEATLRGGDISAPFGETTRLIENVEAVVQSADLTQRMKFTIDARGAVIEAESSKATRLHGEAIILEPFAKGGTLNFGLDRVAGDVDGHNVPSSALQILVSGSGLVLHRDLGELLQIEAHLPPATTDTSREVEIAIDSDRGRVNGTAMIFEDGSLRSESLAIMLRDVDPGLFEAMTGSAQLTSMPEFTVRLTELSIPAPGTDGIDVAAVGVRGRVDVPRTELDGVAEAVTDFTMAIESERLGESINLEGSANIGAGRLLVQESVSGLFDDDGPGVTPSGRVSLENVPAGLLLAFAGEDAVPENVRTAIADEPMQFLLRTRDGGDGLDGELEFNGAGLHGASTVARRGDELRIAKSEITLDVTPDLVRRIQIESENPVALREAMRVEVSVEPIVIAGGSLASQMRAGFLATPAELVSPAMSEPARVHDIGGVFELEPAGTWSFDGKGRIDGATSGANVADVEFLLRRTDADRAPTGAVRLEVAAVATLESTLGLEAGRLSDWVGSHGKITLESTDNERVEEGETWVQIKSEMESLRGDAELMFRGETLEVASKGLQWTVPATRLERWMNGPSDAVAGIEMSPVVRARDDLELTAKIETMRIPLAMFRGEAVVPDAVDIDVTAEGPGLVLEEDERTMSISDVVLRLQLDDLNDGGVFTLTGSTQRDGAEATPMDVRGTMGPMFGDDQTFDLANARLNMTANVQGIPTILADGFLEWNGKLVAAIGPEMGAELTARNFSSETGRVEGRVWSTQGSITGALRGNDKGFRTTDDNPAKGELGLTRMFRRELLRYISPVFADIRTVGEPVRFEVTSPMLLPHDGELRGMRGAFTLTIGDVEFDSGAGLARILAFSNRAPESVLTGHVSPIDVNIKGGVIRYDAFTMQIDKHVLEWEGRVDLVKETVNLRTKLPLASLAHSFDELEGVADKLVVPLLWHGPIDDPKVEIDPDFDFAGAAIDAGFRGTLNRVLEDEGIPLGDLLGDIFGGKKKAPGDGEGK